MICCAMTSMASEPEVLYNGITLPAQWPPRYAEPVEAKEMPVPYLTDKPAVIPINVGRQLFVDNFLISQTDLKPTYHTPDFFEGNPILEPTEEWENTIEGAPYAAPFSDGIWYDDKDGKFKMWYLAGAGSIHKQDKQTFYTGYAESDDGMHWVKPDLELVKAPVLSIPPTVMLRQYGWIARKKTRPSVTKCSMSSVVPLTAAGNSYSNILTTAFTGVRA